MTDIITPIMRRMRVVLTSPPPKDTPMQFPYLGIEVQVQTYILLEHVYGRRHALRFLHAYLTGKFMGDSRWRAAEKWVLAALYDPETSHHPRNYLEE